MATEKVITIGEKNYKIVKPTIGQTTEADIAYSKAYTLAIKAGLLPRAAMEVEVEKNKLWPDENEAKLLQVSEELQAEVAKIRNSETSKADKALARLNFIEKRNEVIRLTALKQSLFMHTAETKGDEAKTSYLISKCVLNEDGSKVWNTQEDFTNERSSDIVERLVQELISFISGLDDKIDQMNSLLEDPNQEEGQGTEDAKLEEVVTEEPVA